MLASIGVSGRAFADEALTIETGSPDALCPELSSTRAAVSRRLGELIVPGGSSGFRARYTIAHAPVGSPRDFVRLELYGPEGKLQLSRDLPLEGESCGTMAEVIALVLDRHFRALLAHDESEEEEEVAALPPAAATAPSFPPQPEAVAPSPAREPSPAAMPSPDVASSAGPSSSTAGSDQLTVGAFELGMWSPDRPALGVRGVLELWPDWYVGTALHIEVRSRAETLRGGGEASSRDASWRLNFGWGPSLGPVRTYIGPGVCLGIASGSGDGLPQQDSGLRALWATGLDAGALWVTEDGWSVGVAAALDISVLSGRFYIDGREVLAPEPVRGWLGISMGHSL